MEQISKINQHEHTGINCFYCNSPIEWDNLQQRLIHECNQNMGVV